MDAIIYYEDGREESVIPRNRKYFTLFEMQQYVNGLIQILPLGEKLMVCNEEGKINGSCQPNWKATDEWVKENGATDVIYGNALICDPVLIR